ncbi:MAG TPA: CoA-binding protein [Bryobacteraceae bacterium]|nr:CoA-binding protein [Bryobacteraceae bacterium]
MTATMDSIRQFLGQQRFAMIGVSRQPGDFSRTLFGEFLRRGYQTIPVNPDAQEIDGHACFAHVADIQPPVDEVLLMTSPAATETLVRECAQAGVKRVWMFRGAGRGSVSPDAVRFCEANGIDVIPGECPCMFLPGEAWFHRFHGFVKRITGTYPH